MSKKSLAIPNKWLLEARLSRHWSQRELAGRIGTSFVNISRWERGTTSPGPYFRRQLCHVFEKSPQELGLTQRDTDEGSKESSLQIANNQVAPSPLSAAFPQFWNVPFRRNPFFTGREALLFRLHYILSTDKTALSQIQSLSGLGGIGKTQIAIEYAFRFRNEYSAVLWLQAETHDLLMADLVVLAELLKLPEKGKLEQKTLLKAVKQWLEDSSNWLLILDNVEDFTILADVLPCINKGHILLTTRAQAMGTLADHITVEQMEPDEGTLFLLRRAKLLARHAFLEDTSESIRVQAKDISQVLDGLPLALDQAGSYIEETGCSLSDYLNRYSLQGTNLLKRRGDVVANHSESVSTTFSLCFDRVRRTSPVAAELLHFCAFLAADAIPEEIFTERASELGPILHVVGGNPVALDAAFTILRKYSLLRRNPQTGTMTIHRLVQTVLKEKMNGDEQRQWAERTIHVVNQAFPDVKELVTWTCCQRYLPHAQICAALIEQWNIISSDAGRLLNQLGTYLVECGQYAQAELLLEKACAIRVQIVGAEHPEVAETLNNIGELYAHQGKYAQAEQLYLQALTIREKILGPEHLSTAESLNNLGRRYHDQGKYMQAEPFLQRALTIREKILGPEHPYVATCLNNLAGLYHDQRKYTQAEVFYLQALAIREKILGPEHPYVATCLNNLARLYHDLGKYAQAEPLHQRALMIREKVLGAEHTSTAISVNNLALLYKSQGQYAQAETLFQRALVIWEKALGSQNPRTAQTLKDLAILYYEQNKYEQAEALYQQVLSIQEKILGPAHPTIVTTLEQYMSLLLSMKREIEATKLVERLEMIRAKMM